jgi:hypothetical protein
VRGDITGKSREIVHHNDELPVAMFRNRPIVAACRKET